MNDQMPWWVKLWILMLAVSFISAAVFIFHLYNAVADHGLKSTIERIWEGPTPNTQER